MMRDRERVDVSVVGFDLEDQTGSAVVEVDYEDPEDGPNLEHRMLVDVSADPESARDYTEDDLRGMALAAAQAVAGLLVPEGPEEQRSILLTELQGAVAKWAVRQSPYPYPQGLDGVLEKVTAAVLANLHRPEAGMPEVLSHYGTVMLFGAAETFGALLDRHLLPLEEVQAWNQRRNGNTAPFGFVSATRGPAPDDDFIDLDALRRNILEELMGSKS